MNKKIKLTDMSKKDGKPLVHLENEDLMPLPYPVDDPSKDHNWTPLSAQARERYECILDDTCVVNVPQPKSKEEKRSMHISLYG